MASQLPASSPSPHASARYRPQPILKPRTGVGPELVKAAEREIGLPVGAWRRRRLFALRVGAPGLPELGIGRGDLLIVEPGQQANCDHLVVIKQVGTLLLRRVVGQARGRHSMLLPPEAGTLPLPLTDMFPDVVGTVIGVLAKPLSIAGSPGRPTNAATASATVLRALNAQRLDSNLRQWWGWVGPSPLPLGCNPRHDRYRQMLGQRLRILSSCMAVAGNHRLHAALLAEANRIITAMQQEVSKHDGPTLLPLLPIPSTAIAATRHRKPHNPQYAHTA